MFGISGSEFLVIILVAVVVVGPQRLPEYTRKLTQLVRQLRVFLDNARSQIAEEVGPEMADLDLSSLDPRQYDPRKIVRDALGEDIDAIREDLAHPFKSVSSAAKEVSDDAAQAVNDVVKQDRAKSLSKQIEAKRAEQLAGKNSTSNAADDAESTTEVDAETTDAGTDVKTDTETDTEADAVQAEASTDKASAESQDAEEGIQAANTPCTIKIFIMLPEETPKILKMAISACFSVTAMTKEETKLKVATATISSRMMNITLFSISTASK